MSEVISEEDIAEGYKQVQLGPRKIKIPETWEKAQLGELGEYLNGYAFKSSDWSNHGRPIIRIQNLTNSAGEETNYYDGEMKDRYVVREGDLLVSWSATLGVFVWDGPEALLNQHIFKVKPSEKVTDDFLYFLLDHNLDLLEMRVQGSTMKHIRKSTFEDTFVPLPPLSEQRRIADILSTVDKKIRQTDEMIGKINNLKQGTIQDALSSDQEEEYRIFGTYPKSWNLKKFSSVCDIIDAEHFTPEYVDDGIPLLRPGDLKPGMISLADVSKMVSEETYEELTRRYKPGRGDIVYSRSQNFAIASRVLEDRRYCIGQDMVVIDPGPVNVSYLLEVLNSRFVLNQAKSFASGSTFDRINLSEIRSFRIPLPDSDTQQLLGDTFTTLRQKLQVEVKRRESLKQIKRGLMQDLLTGKVRVKSDS